MREQRKTASVIPLTNVPGAQVTTGSDEHTGAIIQENPSNLGVHIVNYRLNLTNVLSEITNQASTVAFGRNYMAPGLDGSGNPIVDADGSIATVGNRTLPDRTSRDVRNVTLTIVGTYNGGQPRVTFDDVPGMTRPYSNS